MPYKDKTKQLEYQRIWMAKRRAEFFDGKSCVKCGSTSNLELDHINPATKEHHAIWSWRKSRRETEIAKCQILCNTCHLEKTIAENTQPLIHGTWSGYRKGCRCTKCKAANTNKQRNYRSRISSVGRTPAL